MELLEGETLAQKMNRQPMEMDEAAAAGIQIADALESAQPRGSCTGTSSRRISF